MAGIFFLLLSSGFDAFWNVFLNRSRGFSDWTNNLAGAAFLFCSILSFKKALSYMPMSIAVVVWSGLTILLTVVLDMIFFKTRFDIKLAFFMALCIISILGLNYYANKA